MHFMTTFSEIGKCMKMIEIVIENVSVNSFSKDILEEGTAALISIYINHHGSACHMMLL